MALRGILHNTNGWKMLLGLALPAQWGCQAPDVPHQVTSTEDNYCLSCHEDGSQGSPRMAHPRFSNCTHCHASPEPVASTTNPDAGAQAPSIPHAVTSTADESCRGCHTSGAHATTHAERSGCTACHQPR